MIIIIENVSKKFYRNKMDAGLRNAAKSLFSRRKEEVNAIKNINLTIKQGSIVGLLGANGSGKSTLIKMMTGLIKPTSGKLEVMGHIPSDKKAIFLKNIGVVLGQKNQLWWDLSPYETFILNKNIYNIEPVYFKETIEVLAEKLNVEHILKTPVRNLSLGERMKCELISSLLHKPQVLFLDEPTIGLDFASQKSIRSFLKQYAAENNTTIILTSHYFPDIEQLCEEILILKEGELYYQGSLHELSITSNTYKYIIITFNENINSEVLESWGEVTNLEHNTIKIKIKKADYQTFLGSIFKQYEVIDYHMQDITTQDLLEEIFYDQ